MNRAARHLAVLGCIAWGVVELVALQRSRYRAWSAARV
jgi:hypothetical protein